MAQRAICCMSGGYKGAFVQGVLTALEQANFLVQAYAGCSSSALPVAFAAFREISVLDLSTWREGKKIADQPGNSQSNAVLHSIAKFSPTITKKLFQSSSARCLLACSHVKTEEAAQETQSEKAKSLGRKLIVAAAKRDSSWKEAHLELHLFDTDAVGALRLTADNFDKVAYATTRMLHAWHIPAWVNGEPYIDGSYTSLCPIPAVAALGYHELIAILTEKAGASLDLFSAAVIPDSVGQSTVRFIKPDVDLKELGVDFFSASQEGIERAYQHGLKKGEEFIEYR